MTGDFQLTQLTRRPFGSRRPVRLRERRRFDRAVLVLLMGIALCSLPAVMRAARAEAAVNSWPHTVTGGFATSDFAGERGS